MPRAAPGNSPVNATQHRTELVQLALLAVLVVVFYLAVIPAGIVDPEGLGADDGLPPSFSARLAAALAGVLIIGRALRLLLTDTAAPGDAGEDAEPVVVSGRTVLAVGATLAFALVLAPQLGFFLGGAILMPCLLLVMGEIRLSRLVLYPCVVLTLVWVLFERLLSVNLPGGALLGG